MSGLSAPTMKRRARGTMTRDAGLDTTGHTLATCELDGPFDIALERRRQAEQAARDLGRSGWRQRRLLLERIHARSQRVSESRR